MHRRLARRASAARTCAWGTERAAAARSRRRSTLLAAPASSGVVPARGTTTRRLPRSLLAWALLAVVALGALTAAGAQSTPTVTPPSDPTVALNTNLMRSGDSVALDASNLKSNASYTVTLTAPDGSSQSAKVSADGSGALHYHRVLGQTGVWTVHLSGPGIDAPFRVEVSPVSGGSSTNGGGGAGSANGGAGGGSSGGGSGSSGQAPSTGPSNGGPSNGGPSNGGPSGGGPSGGGSASGGSAGGGTADGSRPQNGQTPGTPQAPGSGGQAPNAAQASGPLQLDIQGSTLVASSNGQEQWRLDFPGDSGDTAGTAQVGGTVYLGHGNSLLAIAADSGTVQQRYLLPAQVVDVAASASGVSVTVQFQEGGQQKLQVTDAGVQGTVRFGADAAMFAWLRNEAKVADPSARLNQDPTNPWLYVEAAKQASDTGTAANDYRQALSHATTFYDRAQLARVLYAADQQDLAKQAIDDALKDYVARGYTAELLTDPDLREAYGFPRGALEQAVSNGDLQAAAFWAPWAYRMSTPAVPATQAALQDYSRALRTAGQRNEASLWRSRAHEGSGFHLQRALRRAALALGRAGWYGVAALLLAMVFLHVTLMAKYWRPQSLALKQRLESGRGTGRVPRLFALRYYTITEKFVLVLMFAAVLALASLSGWARHGDALPSAWRSGTLASVPARDALPSALEQGADADFVRGYAAQVAGDDQTATQAYQAAGDVPEALNNLGALKGDDALYQRSLDVGPDLPAALYNLGRITDPSRLHAAYQPDTPLLAVPSETLLRSAVAGSFQLALASAFTDPWTALTGTDPLAIPHWLWDVLVVLFLAWAAVTVISLVVPRPGVARNAPRSAAYHLLAVLIPGSGLADELWGVLLLVPWAIFGLDTLLHFMPLGEPAGISLTTDYVVLAVIYALNLVSFFVELVSYRRRMAELKRSRPETARAYGMNAGWGQEERPE